MNYTSIVKHIGTADKTVAKYVQLLEALYIIKLVPSYSYSNNMIKRVIKSPKVHFIDSGLASHLLNAGVESSMLGINESIGNLVETFVYGELIKHASYANTDVEIHHYRDTQKREVDFVLETSSGDVVALEVKSSSTIKSEYFRGLSALAEAIHGKNFKGILLYGGDKILPYKIGEHQFWAIPLTVLI